MSKKELIDKCIYTGKESSSNLDYGTLKRHSTTPINKGYSIKKEKRYGNYFYHHDKVYEVRNLEITNDTIKLLRNDGMEKGFLFKATDDAYFGCYLLQSSEKDQDYYYDKSISTKNGSYISTNSDFYSIKTTDSNSLSPINNSDASNESYSSNSSDSLTQKIVDMYLQSFALQDYNDAEEISNYGNKIRRQNFMKRYKKSSNRCSITVKCK
uniref:SH2 domain-containing protein n=1 Tax=Parastrongyloides trichosuri TaxID=131310 RepID=A0A0N4ZTN9_PARTI